MRTNLYRLLRSSPALYRLDVLPRPLQRPVLSGEHIGHRSGDRDLRHDACAGELLTVRERVPRDRKARAPVLGELDLDRLAGAAGRRLADDHAAPGVAEGHEEVLRRAGGGAGGE